MTPPRSILLVRLSALGDVVHVLPCLTALREAFPHAKLGWAVESAASGLLQEHPLLDRVHVVPRKAWSRQLKQGQGLTVFGSFRRIAAEVRAERYEVAIDFQSNMRSALVTRVSGARRRIGQPQAFSKEGSRLLFTETAESIPKSAHKIVRNMKLLEPLGICPAAPPPARIGSTLPTPEQAAALRADPRRRVLIHAGVSAFGALKAWREDRFAALARMLVEAGHRALFSWGSPAERAQAERLVARAPGSEVAPGADSLRALAFSLTQIDLFVGVDSGPLHLAATMGTPVVGLYGPKHTGTYGPFWPGGRALSSGFPCSPCWHRRCPLPEAALEERGDGSSIRISPCMDALSVEAVFEAAAQSLRESPPLADGGSAGLDSATILGS